MQIKKNLHSRERAIKLIKIGSRKEENGWTDFTQICPEIGTSEKRTMKLDKKGGKKRGTFMHNKGIRKKAGRKGEYAI